MKLVAIELSSRQGSIALLEDGELASEKTWTEMRGTQESLFTTLISLLEAEKTGPADIDVFAVGRGPGAYTGLRISLAAAQALALPGGKEVYGISSGEVLAYQLMQESDASSIVIIGDARRDRVWYRVFEVHDGRLMAEGDWDLSSIEAFGDKIPEGAVMATPDWQRLAGTIASGPLAHEAWIEEDSYPHASYLGELAQKRISESTPSEPLAPIYMHPAVFVEPRS